MDYYCKCDQNGRTIKGIKKAFDERGPKQHSLKLI